MITLDNGLSERLKEGMNVGSSIELPFFAPVFWVMNGDPKLRQVGGVHYFGGFAVSAEDWQKACFEEWGLSSEPAGIVKTEINTTDGRDLDIYASRHLIVAPICSRITWSSRDGMRYTEYVQGTRQHAQVLAYLAVKTESGIEPLNIVMLSAKGYQAKNMLDAFGAWDRATKQVRGKVAPGVPAWCFYLSIGTFGNDRKQIMVGKGNSQSAITPISAYIPKEITPEIIEKLFVGQDVAEAMVTYLESSQEWLHAYDQKSGNGSTKPVEAPPEPDFGDLDPIPPAPDDVPF